MMMMIMIIMIMITMIIGAVTITIASFFVLIPEIASRISNGFWICLVCVIIRRDNSSSSFSMGYQRLEFI
jgi:hypothetical protein